MSERKKPAQLKLMAKRALMGNYGAGAGYLLVIGLIMLVMIIVVELIVVGTMIFAGVGGGIMGYRGGATIAAAGAGAMLTTILMTVLSLLSATLFTGYLKICRDMCTGKDVEFPDLFYAFSHGLGKFLLLTLFFMALPVLINIPLTIMQFASLAGQTSFVTIMTLIIEFLLFAIILALNLNYSLSFLILIENPDKGVVDSLKESRQIMKGNKRRLFYLYLTFIGICLLAYGSFGIGFLWVTPYMVCTYIFFYFDITSQSIVGEKKDVDWNTVNVDETADGDSVNQ